MGAEVGLLMAGLVSAIGGITAASISSSGAQATNAQQIGATKELQEDAQQYNTEMYNRQVADARQNYAQQRDDQQNFYKQYQSPQAIASQLQKIGINPSAVFGAGKGLQGMPTVPSIASPSAPTSPLGSIGSLMNPMASYGAVIPQMADSVSKLSSAGLDSAKTKETRDTLRYRIEQMIAETGNTKMLTEYQSLQNDITKIFGKAKAGAEISDLLTHAFLNQMAGNSHDALSKFHKAQTLIAGEDLKMKKEEAAVFAQKLANMITLTEEQIKTEKAKQTESYSSAKEHNAGAELKTEQATTESVLRGLRANLTKAQIDEIKAKTGLDEQKIAQGLRDAMQAKDQAEFWKNHPSLRQAVSIAKNASESFWSFISGNGALLKGVFN